jgi:2-oxoglutarate ferredoxin oxidoreductase subunit delta
MPKKVSSKKKATDRPKSEGTESASHKEYDIDIYRAWCKQCGLCAAFCPRECLALDEEGAPEVVNPERCTGCGWCELHCPDFAICVREQAANKSSAESDD